jgi:phage terminase large subunit-like protein
VIATKLDAATQYAWDVMEGRQVAGKWVRLACERHLRDLERAGTQDFPYVFNPEKAERVFAFFRFCRHVKGPLAGKPVELEPWQRFLLGNLFGWVHMDTGYRRFRKSYTQVASGNGKSTVLSGLGLYMLMADGEFGAEVYAAATKAEQARIVFNAARVMATRSPELLRRLEPKRGRIEHPATESFFRPLSKDDQQKGDGLAPHLAIIDEYHAHPTSEIYDVLAQSLAKRAQPLLFVITTAGFDLSSPCYEEYQYACKVLEGDVENEEYFAYIAQLDADDDPKDECVWIKSNPLVATTEWGMRSLRAQLKEALEVPSKMRHFLTKNMNMWVDQKEDGYMNMAKWRSCAATKDNPIPDLTGAPCYIGVDLSAKIDLCSVALEFPLGNGRFAVRSHSFIPEERLRERMKTDKRPYDAWVRLGWLSVIPGAVVDQEAVIEWIEKQVEMHGWKVQEICGDPWNATQFGIEIQRRGYVWVEIIQGVRTLSEPTKDFRERVYRGQIIHDGSPVLQWAMSNAVEKIDAKGNIMLDKEKSREKIDPVAALMNAHTRAIHYGKEATYDPNRYATAEILEKLWG